MKINSPDNERIKYLCRLRKSAEFRRQERKFLIEGYVAVRSILENRRRPLEIFWCLHLLQEPSAILEAAEKLKIPLTELSSKAFAKISDVQSPLGIAALFPFFEYDPMELFRNRAALFISCHGVQDPGNLGTLIRTADAAGAAAVITLPPSASFYNPKVVRASAGSILNIPLLSLEENEFLNYTKKFGLHLFAAVPRGGRPFRKVVFKRPCCIMLGSEAHGLPPAIRNISTPVTIPMREGVESLNTAVAGALLLYQTAVAYASQLQRRSGEGEK